MLDPLHQIPVAPHSPSQAWLRKNMIDMTRDIEIYWNHQPVALGFALTPNDPCPALKQFSPSQEYAIANEGAPASGVAVAMICDRRLARCK